MLGEEWLEVRVAPSSNRMVGDSDPASLAFGDIASTWQRDYVDARVGGKSLVAASTRQKYRHHLHKHILPRWAGTRIRELRAKDILNWLQTVSGSWYMMTDLRNIMSGIFTKAQEWEVLPETLANPISRVKLPKKWEVYEKRILTEEETVRVLARLKDPNLLTCELCLATGARISEVTGLQIKHVLLAKGCIRIEQRHWRGDIDSPKTERSRRTLTIGSLASRLQNWIESLSENDPAAWVFPQHDTSKPMWDSGIRVALKEAAQVENCDFPGFGLHSLRRANITWRQEVGGSSIEASRIAGHASTRMTEAYTVVQLNRQAELTRRIQEKLDVAAGKIKTSISITSIPDPSPIADKNCLASESNPGHECERPIPEKGSEAMATLKNKVRKSKKPRVQGSKNETKQSLMVTLLKRPNGVTLQELMAATDWQAHSVRGFLSAGVGKKMGLKLKSRKGDDGHRIYQIR